MNNPLSETHDVIILKEVMKELKGSNLCVDDNLAALPVFFSITSIKNSSVYVSGYVYIRGSAICIQHGKGGYCVEKFEIADPDCIDKVVKYCKELCDV